MLFKIAKRHGLDLEEEAEYGNRQYLEKQDYILAKQKEQLVAQQNRLDELTLKFRIWRPCWKMFQQQLTTKRWRS